MKRRGWIVAALLLATGLEAQSFRELLRQIEKAPSMERAEMLSRAAREQARAQKGVQMPSLDLSLEGRRLREEPTVALRLPPLSEELILPLGSKRHFVGELRLSYPLFTGFALSARIESSRLEAIRAELKKRDLLRNLALKLSELYGGVRSAQKILEAQKAAKEAMLSAQKKAQGLYKNGLLPPADLYNIEAKVYAIDAQIAQTRGSIRELLNRLEYLCGCKVEGISGGMKLKKLPSRRKLKELAERHRSDLRALRIALKVDEEQIRLARSRFYPQVGVAAGLRRQGDSLALDGDGVSNADQSYVGFSLSWNLFSGGKDRHTLEAARYKRLAGAKEYLDYRRRVEMEIDNAWVELETLRARYRSAAMQVKSAYEYYRLTRGRFDNQLAGADELGRAIADWANARAQREVIRERMQVQRAKLWLMAGMKSFREALGR